MKPASKLTVTSLALLAVLALAVAARAGDVVVPLTANQTLQDLTYTTRLWIANPTVSPQTFTGVFYPAGTDGTTEPPASPAQTAAAGQTRVYSSAVALGGTGFLAVRGADDLRLTARLETRSGDRLLGASPVPIVTADNAFAAGATVQIAGFERTAGATASDLYLLNLDAAAGAQCSLRLLRADGTVVADGIAVQLAPRQRRDFVDALGVLQQSGVTDQRFEASCDHRFWAGGVLRRAAAAASVLVPATATAGTLFGSGTQPPPSDGSVVFTVPGLFLNAVRGDSYRTYTLPLVEGKAYRKSVVDFDLLAGRFPDGNFTGIHSLRRAHKQRSGRVLYYGLTVNNFNNRSVIDLGKNELLVKGDGPWVPKHAYHVRFTYDLMGEQVQLEIFEGGTRLLNLTGPAQHDDLSFDGNPVSVDFGQTGVADGAYFPPIGWQYSNLRVVVTP